MALTGTIARGIAGKGAPYSSVCEDQSHTSTVHSSVGSEGSNVPDVSIESEWSASDYSLTDDALNSQISLQFLTHIIHINKQCLHRLILVHNATSKPESM